MHTKLSAAIDSTQAVVLRVSNFTVFAWCKAGFKSGAGMKQSWYAPVLDRY
jgi:hypothetical protein